MRAYDLILKKREGKALSQEEINFLIENYVNGQIPDYQIAAFLMAVFFQGLTDEETYNLTNSMRYSGDTVDLSGIEGIKVDKHSTGGVGDKTTLALGPMVASCGVKVAKLSGKGLGHTGGTIDKLESIPGFKTSISMDKWVRQVNETGIAIAGQTANLVPADKKLYALRDVTATVDQVSLIASSIMSKKLAGGADAFVLDVKVGSGAFMKSIEGAKKLAGIMVDIALKDSKRACALITNMDQPLGRKIGNALEVVEAVETLKGKGPGDFSELCFALGAKMLEYGGNIEKEEAFSLLRESIYSGKALNKFRELIVMQGGDPSFLENPMELVRNKYEFTLKASGKGYISSINTEGVGYAAMLLGAGRNKKEDVIDYSAGLEFLKKTGNKVDEGEGIVKVFYNDIEKFNEALPKLESSITIKESCTEEPVLIFDIIE